jgi:hypothetical protein
VKGPAARRAAGDRAALASFAATTTSTVAPVSTVLIVAAGDESKRNRNQQNPEQGACALHDLVRSAEKRMAKDAKRRTVPNNEWVIPQRVCRHA